MWRTLRIHESSPGSPSSRKLELEAPRYSASFWWPDAELGTTRNRYRNEDLEQLTFPDESFDLFVTQDVFEHIFDAPAAFREIARVLRPGGAHVFTIPYWADRSTQLRAIRSGGDVVHLRRPIYHFDPIDPSGALVVRDWGTDSIGIIDGACGLETEMLAPHDVRKGLDGDFLNVFITRKPS
jgi:SAM-dependent methyltransferase